MIAGCSRGTRFIGLLAFLLASRLVLASGSEPLVNLSAKSIEEGTEPTIDGRVDEDVWLEVEPFTGFTQQNPYEGAPATERTEVRVLVGRKTLFIGIIALDSEPDQILVT